VLGRTMNRPACFRIPGQLVSFLFGEMGRETLLASQRCLPRVLVDSKFHFAQPGMEQTLGTTLGKVT